MKVLLIDVNCKYSSTGKIVYDLFRKLKEDNHEAAICYGRGEVINEEGIYKFGLDWETRIHAGLARITGLNGYFSPVSTRRLIKFIEKFQPDVIHLHELHAYFVNIKPLIKYIKSKKIKVVWTFHCEYMYTGKCGYAYDCLNFQNGCGNCPALRDYPKSLFFDRTRKMLKDKKDLLIDMDFTIVTPSQWLADRVRLSFLKDKEIRVIHNGIDTENVFYPRDVQDLRKKLGLQDKKVVLSVAPNIMDERKGGDIILKLSEKLKEMQFVLVGADETKRYSGNVLMIKRTKDQNELAKWYSLADLFLICSKRENFPTTCLEALACGTPVVGIDEGGTKETASEPYGLFFKADSLDKMLDGIKKQINMHENKEDISLYGKKLYSQQTMYNNYKKIFEMTYKN